MEVSDMFVQPFTFPDLTTKTIQRNNHRCLHSCR